MCGEGDLSWDLGQWGVDELLEIDFFILDIVQRLARAQRSLAEAQRTGRFVAVERLHIEHLQGIGYVLCAQCRPLPVSHELESFLQHLGQTEVNVACQLFYHIVGE